MKTLLIAALAGTILSPVAELTSTYEAKEIRTTTFSYEESNVMVDMQMLMNGEENPMMGGDMDASGTDSSGGVFTDTILRSTDGMPTSFTRLYSDLNSANSSSMYGPMGDMDSDNTMETELNDLTVTFTFDEEEYTAEFPEGEAGDEELLEGLDGLLPWADFLSRGSVDVEDEWDVEPKMLWDTFHLGGELSFENTSEEDSMMAPPAGEEDLLEVDGEITATLKSIEDGIATITLAIEVTEFMDLTELAIEMAENAPDDAMPEGMMMPEIMSMEIEKEYEGEGTILWDIDGGYLVNLELSLEYSESQAMSMMLSMGPEDMEIEQNTTTEGEITYTVEVEVTRE
jgi:hypothetical protein